MSGLRPLTIGKLVLPGNVIAAPMAGVTDRPFRELCRRLGADLAVAEMLTADQRLWHTRKSRLRMDHRGETGPIVVQIAGAEPQMLANAARVNVDHGAQMIDINMGCPAKKVLNKAAGSALMEDEPLVAEILQTVVGAVDVPVSLKIRTGPTPKRRNALHIAKLAQDAGIAMLSVHGRTRADKYRGRAEFDTIAQIREAIDIPLIANGDIVDARSAKRVFDHTQADGIMIGRAAQGNPWVFSEIKARLSGQPWQAPSDGEVHAVMVEHLLALFSLYGAEQGVRVARKHLGWYLTARSGGELTWRALMQVTTPDQQLRILAAYFTHQAAA